jgi:hypothetical protein
MESGRPRGLAALLTLALSAGTVAGAGPLGSPAWADDAPAGTFSLDSTDIWTAQQVTLTQTALVDPTPETPLARIVDWGDGTGPLPLDADAVKVKHKYPDNGDYQVKVTLRDADGTGDVGGTISNDTSTVHVATAPAGAYGFAPASTFIWEGGGSDAKFTLSGVPAKATRVWVNWGDGELSLLSPRTASTIHYYDSDLSSYTPSVTLENAQGKTLPQAAGSFSMTVDSTPPTATLTVPSSPTKAASWKTVQGTAKDTQIGMDSVGVQLWLSSSTAFYYYNFSTKKWVKYIPGSSSIPNAAITWLGVDSAGVWKVAVAGLSKGYTLEVDYTPVDRAGNYGALRYKMQKLTS